MGHTPSADVSQLLRLICHAPATVWGSAGWRISRVHLEHDELGEHITVHLKPIAASAVGGEPPQPSSPEGRPGHRAEIQAALSRVDRRNQGHTMLPLLVPSIGVVGLGQGVESHRRSSVIPQLEGAQQYRSGIVGVYYQDERMT